MIYYRMLHCKTLYYHIHIMYYKRIYYKLMYNVIMYNK